MTRRDGPKARPNGGRSSGGSPVRPGPKRGGGGGGGEHSPRGPRPVRGARAAKLAAKKLRLKSKPREVACPLCDKKFRTPEGLLTHQRDRHGVPQDPQAVPEGHTTCPVCGVLVRQKRLAKHLLHMHGQV